MISAVLCNMPKQPALDRLPSCRNNLSMLVLSNKASHASHPQTHVPIVGIRGQKLPLADKICIKSLLNSEAKWKRKSNCTCRRLFLEVVADIWKVLLLVQPPCSLSQLIVCVPPKNRRTPVCCSVVGGVLRCRLAAPAHDWPNAVSCRHPLQTDPRKANRGVLAYLFIFPNIKICRDCVFEKQPCASSVGFGTTLASNQGIWLRFESEFQGE